MKRQITFAGACYDRTQALIDGTVKPDGLEFNWLILHYPEIWRRMLNDYDFDASELSLVVLDRQEHGKAVDCHTGLSRAHFSPFVCFHQQQERDQSARRFDRKESRSRGFPTDSNGLDARDSAK
jgi:hypothetical protein